MTLDPVTFAKALADDTRQRIMKMLCCEWMSVGDVVTALSETNASVSQPTVSHHLSILKVSLKSVYLLTQDDEILVFIFLNLIHNLVEHLPGSTRLC